jgi:hypothetical protein
MRIVAFVLVSLVALIPPADAGSASQTFSVSLDRAWSTTEKVLDVLGWEISVFKRERILWIAAGVFLVPRT